MLQEHGGGMVSVHALKGIELSYALLAGCKGKRAMPQNHTRLMQPGLRLLRRPQRMEYTRACFRAVFTPHQCSLQASVV